MSGNWEQYFERKNTTIDGKNVEYYEYKDKQVKTLPDNLPMPPTDIFYNMFNVCEQLKDITALANWDVSNVENMRDMFCQCIHLQEVTALANWDVSKVENMDSMFINCGHLQDITALANWDVSNVENMRDMFWFCSQLQDFTPLANWDVSNVKNMHGMFLYCCRLQDLTALANWDVSKVENMDSMFTRCVHLQDITALTNWDVSNVKYMRYMFRDCEQLTDITALANWDVSNVWNMEEMFDRCQLRNISKYTDCIKSHLQRLPKRSYPKQDHTSLLKSLWDRVKPLLKYTTPLNNHFKSYTIEVPVEVKALQKENSELKARVAYLEEKLNSVMAQLSESVKWNP